jgi:hypothetical protein
MKLISNYQLSKQLRSLIVLCERILITSWEPGRWLSLVWWRENSDLQDCDEESEIPFLMFDCWLFSSATNSSVLSAPQWRRLIKEVHVYPPLVPVEALTLQCLSSVRNPHSSFSLKFSKSSFHAIFVRV